MIEKMRNWKWLGLLALGIAVAIPVTMTLTGASQPSPPTTPSQPESYLNAQNQDDAFDEPVLDEEGMLAMVFQSDDLAEDMEGDEAGEFAFFSQEPMMMMNEGNAEQKKLVKQNHLLLLLNRLGLTKEQLQQLKAITGDLKKEKESHQAAMAQKQKELNNFLLKFNGSEEDLKKALQEMRKGDQDAMKAHHEKIAAAEKQIKQLLNWEQGEKLMKMGHGNQERRQMMFFGPGMNMMQQHNGGPRAFFFNQHGNGPAPQLRDHMQGLQKMIRQHMQMGKQQGNQPPMMMQPGQRGPQMMQGRKAAGPQVGPLGHFLMMNVEVLDEVLAAKLAALGS